MSRVLFHYITEAFKAICIYININTWGARKIDLYKIIKNVCRVINKRARRPEIVVYTAIFGEYDVLNEPEDVGGCDFVCFTDNPKLSSDKFDIRLCVDGNDPVRESRKYKILPHRFLTDYKYSIWMDGNIILKKINTNKLIKQFLSEQDLAIFSHPERNCIYEELAICKELKKYDCDLMDMQVRRYEEVGYPKNNGLIASGFIVRRTLSPEVIRFCEDWWYEIKNNSRRDQLSFNYVAWKNTFKYTLIDGCVWDNEYFKVCSHNDNRHR